MQEPQKLVINIVTYFKDIHSSYFNHSFFKKLILSGNLQVNVYSLIEFSRAKKTRIDDNIFGGGNGMVMRPDILNDFIVSQNICSNYIIHPSPSGILLNTCVVKKIAKNKSMTFICSRYDGIDARAIQHFSMKEISIGDYVLYDGDTAAMVIINAVVRDIFVKPEAKICESFSCANHGLLESPMYTRPKEFCGMIVPDVLTGGNHNNINRWRELQSIKKTGQNRPDLLESIKPNINNKHEKDSNT